MQGRSLARKRCSCAVDEAERWCACQKLLLTVGMSPVGPGEEVPFLAAIWLPHGGQLWDQLDSS